MQADSSPWHSSLDVQRHGLLHLFDDVPSRTLLQIVHHCRPTEEGAVALILTLAGIATWLQGELQRMVAALGFSSEGWGALLALYAVDPEPVAPADLAGQVGIDSANLARELRPLVRSGHVARQHRGTRSLALTDSGRETVQRSVQELIDALGTLGRRLPPHDKLVLAQACSSLRALTVSSRAGPPASHS